MDENYSAMLQTKYSDESEEVKALYRFLKDKQATRKCIEGIYGCTTEKELVTNVLVPMYIQGRPRETLNKSSFITMLLQFSEKTFNVRSVQRYIRNLFESDEVQEARRKAEAKRAESFRNHRVDDPRETSSTLIIPNIDKLGRGVYDEVICLLKSYGVQFDEVAPATWLLGKSACMCMCLPPDYSPHSCRITCATHLMPQLMDSLQLLFGSSDPMVEYVSPKHSRVRATLSVARQKADE